MAIASLENTVADVHRRHAANLSLQTLRSQSRTERKPTVHKLLPAAQSDPETGVYERPMQPLRTHRATLVASRVRRCKHDGNI